MKGDMRELDDILAAARDAERPGDDLVARVLADAEAVQTARPVPAGPLRDRTGLGWLSGIGGWFGAGGLAAAMAAGLVIGIYAPASVDSALGGQLSSMGLVQTDGLLPGLSDLLPGGGG